MAEHQSNKGFADLLKVTDKLTFEPHDIAPQLDQRGCYEVTLDREFPFLIKLFHYSSKHHTRGPTWHERLELFVPLDEPARVWVGGCLVNLGRGDLLMVDSLKLHNVVDFPGFNTRVVVVSFMPEFVFSLGSPSCDYSFLLPFYSSKGSAPQVLRLGDTDSSLIHGAMARLLGCYFNPEDRQFYQAGCKACLLEILFNLLRHFRHSEILRWESMRQHQMSLRLKDLFEHVAHNYTERISVAQAAALARMSPARFMKTFKKVAGMTFVAYLHHVRLANAVRLLRQTDLSIGDIAARVGFADQSYFDRRFRISFGQTPRQFRAGVAKASA